MSVIKVSGVEHLHPKETQYDLFANWFSLGRVFHSCCPGLPDCYHANDASVGDLDGDGSYELFVHIAGRGRDNSQDGPTDPPIVHAYSLDGQLLWHINLGHNMREGAHYNPFLVFDFDGDGRAELVCRTADGTIDGTGQVIQTLIGGYQFPTLKLRNRSRHRRPSVI